MPGSRESSDGDTEPIPPDSFTETVITTDDENVFGCLRPLNDLAQNAFHSTLDHILKYNLDHARRFVHSTGKSPVRLPSVFTSDGSVEGNEPESTDPLPRNQWVGAFRFSLDILPQSPAEGWYLGSGREKPDTDVRLTPPSRTWKNKGIAGSHARLFIHKQSCRVVVEARHRMCISTTGRVEFIETGVTRVLDSGQMVQLGDLTYMYEDGEAITNGNFSNGIHQFMRSHNHPQWEAHRLLSLPSGGDRIILGNEFTCLPGAFAQGSRGQLTAGWAHDGAAVAIKRFVQPVEDSFEVHKKIMDCIKTHVSPFSAYPTTTNSTKSAKANVLSLVHSCTEWNIAFPGAYCVYTPLALMDLHELKKRLHPVVPAQVSIFIDYLQGLAYLHSKGIIHRDIKAPNLGVVSLNPIKGVIMDLDDATQDDVSDDHMKGTLPYLAPEIIKLKLHTNAGPSPPPYDKAIDVWALGLTMCLILEGGALNWQKLDRTATNMPILDPICNLVTSQRYDDFVRTRVHNIPTPPDLPHVGRYLRILQLMLAWNSKDRITASDALASARDILPEPEEDSADPKVGSKRPIDKI